MAPNLVDLPPLLGTLVGEPLVYQRHNFIEQLTADRYKQMRQDCDDVGVTD